VQKEPPRQLNHASSDSSIAGTGQPGNETSGPICKYHRGIRRRLWSIFGFARISVIWRFFAL
jgi:hypothetical protein